MQTPSSRKATLAIAWTLCAAIGPVAAQPNASAPVRASTILHSDGSQTSTQTDPAAGTVETTTRDASGALTRRKILKSGQDGRAVSAEVYDGRGRLQYRSEFIRDALGHVSEEIRRTAAGGLIQRLVFESAPDGRILRTRAFGPDGRPMSPDSPLPVVRGPAPVRPATSPAVRRPVAGTAQAPLATPPRPSPTATPTPTPRSRPTSRPSGRP